MAGNTKGPWRANNNPNSNYGLEVVADGATKAKRVVCRAGGPDRDANARLIAAAPDLLAALESIAEGAGEYQSSWRVAARAALLLAKQGAATTNEEAA